MRYKPQDKRPNGKSRIFRSIHRPWCLHPKLKGETEKAAQGRTHPQPLSRGAYKPLLVGVGRGIKRDRYPTSLSRCPALHPSGRYPTSLDRCPALHPSGRYVVVSPLCELFRLALKEQSDAPQGLVDWEAPEGLCSPVLLRRGGGVNFFGRRNFEVWTN